VAVPSTTPIASADRKGACPSVHEPFHELDGALLRLRLPGGVLGTGSARAVAHVVTAVGGGAVEITNRANLQLRGIPPASVPEVRAVLVDAGLAAPSARADERRNVLASPTAGVDAAELADTGPLVTTTAERLAANAATGCGPKFGVLLDGGGAVHVRGREHDLVFGAVRTRDGRVRYDVRLAAALPLEYRTTDALVLCAPDDVLGVVDAAIEICRPYGRARGALDALGPARTWAAVLRRAGDVLVPAAGADVERRRIGASPPAVGILEQRQSGRVAVGAAALLGRLDAATLEAVADLVDAYSAPAGDADRAVRLSPDRGIVVCDVPAAAAAAVTSRLDGLGLITDRDHPANVVVACAGSRGCAAGLVDTLEDARTLVGALVGVPTGRRPRSVHVSGCEKGCASPRPTEWALVGGPRPGTYAVHRDRTAGSDGATRSRYGVEIAHGLDASAAVAFLTGRRRSR
jgi:precorrin-3B synthase